MYATAEGTARYAGRFPEYRDTAFYRSAINLSVSSLGIGTYLGREEDATDRAYTDALIAAAENGINLFDAAINYRGQRSEQCIGEALKELQRDEIVVCTKAGFLTPGAVPGILAGTGRGRDALDGIRISWPIRWSEAAPISAWTPSTSSICTIPKPSSAF